MFIFVYMGIDLLKAPEPCQCVNEKCQLLDGVKRCNIRLPVGAFGIGYQFDVAFSPGINTV